MAEGLTPCYTIGGSTDPDDWGAVPSTDNATWNATLCDFDADGYRLPTRAEWKQAAKGGPANDSYLYSGSNTASEVAWSSDNSSKSQPVKGLAPNSAGIYDMSGNVWEWCWDNDSAGSSNRVACGGSCANGASLCTVSSQRNISPSYQDNNIGFRLVRKAP